MFFQEKVVPKRALDYDPDLIEYEYIDVGKPKKKSIYENIARSLGGFALTAAMFSTAFIAHNGASPVYAVPEPVESSTVDTMTKDDTSAVGNVFENDNGVLEMRTAPDSRSSTRDAVSAKISLPVAPNSPTPVASPTPSPTGTPSNIESTSGTSKVEVIDGSGKLERPVSGGTSYTSPYGWRIHPVMKTKRFHTGVDYGRSCGTNTFSVAPGTVIFVGWDGAYGNRVEVKHNNDLITTYSHLSSFNVKVGDKVNTGQVVGKIGTTGLSTGCHLHFEVGYKGHWVNPDNWFKGKGGSNSELSYAVDNWSSDGYKARKPAARGTGSAEPTQSPTQHAKPAEKPAERATESVKPTPSESNKPKPSPISSPAGEKSMKPAPEKSVAPSVKPSPKPEPTKAPSLKPEPPAPSPKPEPPAPEPKPEPTKAPEPKPEPPAPVVEESVG